VAERTTYETLRRLVRALAEELAGFRRRALAAEARVRELESQQPPTPMVNADPGLASRVVALEAENAELLRRIEAASARAERIRSRVRFLRQQSEEAP
jgi:hypothetical protein